jgi:hypothetical protein
LKIVVWLLLLSLFDTLLTHVGLHTKLIEESNPLAYALYQLNITAFYGWKIALPLLLIYIYPSIHSHAGIRQGINAAFLLYAVVLVYHLFWISVAIM